MFGGWFRWILITYYLVNYVLAQYPAAVPPPGYGQNNPPNVIPSGYGIPGPSQPSYPSPSIPPATTVIPVTVPPPSTVPPTVAPTPAPTTVALTGPPAVAYPTVAPTPAPTTVAPTEPPAGPYPIVTPIASSPSTPGQVPPTTLTTVAVPVYPSLETTTIATQPPPATPGQSPPPAYTQVPTTTAPPSTQPNIQAATTTLAVPPPYVATDGPPGPNSQTGSTFPPFFISAQTTQPPVVQIQQTAYPAPVNQTTVGEFEIPIPTLPAVPETESPEEEVDVTFQPTTKLQTPTPTLKISTAPIASSAPTTITKISVTQTITLATSAPPAISGPPVAPSGYGAPPPPPPPPPPVLLATYAPTEAIQTPSPAPPSTVDLRTPKFSKKPSIDLLATYADDVMITTRSRAAVISGTTEKPTFNIGDVAVGDAPSINGECDVKNPISCNKNFLEICGFHNGSYRCECPPNHSRLEDGRCLVINECFDRKLNDCADEATCTDTLESYVCNCKKGYVDLSPEKLKPGRICKKSVNECSDPKTFNVDCDENAKCEDTPDSFTCTCNPGFIDVSERFSLNLGRKCDRNIDPCGSPDRNDCSKNATCTSNKGIYTCQCKSGYSDVSPNKHYPGRDCRHSDKEFQQPSSKCDPKKENSCPKGEKCTDSTGDYMCQCARGTVRAADGSCVVADSCSGKTDCDANANCVSRPGSFDCECKAGYTDVSLDQNKRGRKCVLPESDCSNKDKNDCSVFANCHPEISGYKCQCQSGYLDVSSQMAKLPGRVCIKEKDECSDFHLNSCDDNADCIKKPEGYACLCQKGYTDVSSNANLKPGRICVLQTNCPITPVDLYFLLDGSGSIGAATFKNEVLKFVSEFVSLFTIGPDQTRIGVIQYSDIIKREIDLDKFPSLPSLQKGIGEIQYLAGLTHTGGAINEMVKNGFSESHGARPDPKNFRRVAIVITDGRSQDEVKGPAKAAREKDVTFYSVGVTDHVQESQLIDIAGNASRVFIVGSFKDLNTRLRAAIQKDLCEGAPNTEPPKPPGCDPARNYILKDGKCICPPGFCEDPATKTCGAQLCNPDLSFVTCPFPLVCKITPFKNYRCACPDDYSCELNSGECVNKTLPLEPCPEGKKRNPATNKCEGCIPVCDANKKQICITGPKGELFCGCPPRHGFDPVTGVCTINECLIPGMSNCSINANCTDTLEGYFCTCLTGFKDVGPPDKPGTVCEKIENPCDKNTHNCSKDAECIPDTLGHFTCRCKNGTVDKFPPMSGRDCVERKNECLDPALNNCSKNAICYDLEIGYKCICKEGYQDLKPYEDPGRFCVIDPCQDETKNDCWLKRCRVVDITTGQFTCEPCPSGYIDADTTRPGRNCQTKVEPCADRKRNTCDPNAFCRGIPGKPDDYTCICRDGYLDVSSSEKEPGRKCEPIKNPCFDVTKNDCDPNAFCINLNNNKYNCSCKEGFKDKSPESSKPGRVCKPVINYCLVSQLNNCSAFAFCTNLEDGYNCTCKEPYKDKTEKPLFGRVCVFVPDPCSSPSLNECDVHAKCIRIDEDKYKCECLPPYKENSTNPATPGRRCIYDGCSSKIINTCSANAECVNGDGYVNCKCKEGYMDEDQLRPGTKCVPEPLCGDHKCNKTLGLQCNPKINKCVCKEGWAQKTETSKCVECHNIDLYLWVVRRNKNIYTYSAEYGDLTKSGTQEIVKMFTEGVGKTYDITSLSSCYVNSNVREIQNPNNRNPNWDRGLWVEFSGCFDKTCAPDDYAAWRTLVDTIKIKFNFSVGGTELYINEYQLPFACRKNTCDKNANCTEITPTSYTCICFPNFVDNNPENPGRSCSAVTTVPTTTAQPCGSQLCKPFIGEVCENNRCVCTKGKARKNPNDECEEYDHLWYVPIIITHQGLLEITHTIEFNDVDSKPWKEIIPNYIKNIDQSFKCTEQYSKIVAEGVKTVTKPSDTYPDFKVGIMLNTSVALKKGVDEKELCRQLLECIRNNNNLVGFSPLKVDEEFDFCNPKPRITTVKPTTEEPFVVCNGAKCKKGQFCVNGKCVDCQEGQWKGPSSKGCEETTPCSLRLWILRRYENIIMYNNSFITESTKIRKESTDSIVVGVPTAFDKKGFGDNILDVDVHNYTKPPEGDKGVMTDFTVYFKKDGAPDGGRCLMTLVVSIVDNFNYSIGGTPFFINNVPPCSYNKNDQCKQCPEGTMDAYPMAPGTNCKKNIVCGGVTCKQGQFCVDGKCTDCPEGQFMNSKTEKCEPLVICGGVTCKPGQFCVDGKCSDCPLGQFMNSKTDKCEPLVACNGITCKPGQFCVDGVCSDCPSGQFMNNKTSKCESLIICAGVTCKPGQFCVDGKCSDCPEGQFMNDKTSKCEQLIICNGVKCKPGQFCVDGKCSDCPEGQFMNNKTSKCEPLLVCGGVTCKAGQFCVDGKCSDCPEGQFMNDKTSKCEQLIKCNGVTCKPGQFCVDGKCSDCPEGQFMNDKTSKCEPLEKCNGKTCKPGQFCVDGKCSDCPAGQFMNNKTSKCEQIIKCNGEMCKAGQFCADGKCSDCPDGQFMNDKTSKCEQLIKCNGVTCKPGQFCVDGKCSDCPEGQFMNNKTSKCEPLLVCAGVTCKPGQFCVDGKCSDCPDGQFMNDKTSKCEQLIKCNGVTCKPGQFCVDGKCSDCPEGQFMNDKTSKCEQLIKCNGVTCKPGQFCVDGKCSDCPEGQFMNNKTSKCEPLLVCAGVTCKPGQFCVDGKCSDCPEGQFMNEKTSKCEQLIKCNGVTCKPGQFCVDGKCSDCPEGQFMNDKTSKCEQLIKCNGVTCKPGQFCVDGKCSDCPEGQFMNDKTSKCEPLVKCNGKTCKPGQFCVDGKCSDCPAGQFMNNKTSKCEPLVVCNGVTCKAGQFCVDGKCSNCPNGQFMNNKTAKCEPLLICAGVTCKPGQFCVNGKCSDCPDGQFMNNKTSKCEPLVVCNGITCKPGQFCVNGRCVDCPEGQWMNPKSSKCEDAAKCDMTLWVVRKNEDRINYNTSYADPDSGQRKEMTDAHKKGVPEAYNKAGVDSIMDVDMHEMSKAPENKQGVITEFTAYFKKDGAPKESECLDKLVTAIVDNFNYSIGDTPYFINDQVPPCTLNPKTPCKACPEGTTDGSPMTPGKNCVEDPCAKHNCDINSVCVPLAKGGCTCSCKKGFKANATDSNDSCKKKKNCFYDFCLDFPDCETYNGTCHNYKEFAKCECNKNFMDLRKYPPLQKRICHGDAFCVRENDVDFCCLQAHGCHASANCVKVPTGGYQCRCGDGSTVGDGVACPAGAIPSSESVKRDPRCPQCNNNGDCVTSDLGGRTICECSTWYTGETCATDIRIILAIIFAILFLLLTLCCLIYYCLKCRCFGAGAGGAATYREMSSSDSQTAFGKESDLYQDFAIPRAKLKDSASSSAVAGRGSQENVVVHREQRSMERYLDSHDRAPSVERVGANTVAMSDVIHRIPAGPSMATRQESDYYSSGSDVSSGSSFQEQYERRVTTDYKKSETTKTTAAANTTAEFRVIPPVNKTDAVTNGEGKSVSKTYKTRTTTTTSTRSEDADDASSDGSSTVSQNTVETAGGDTYDKKTLVKRTHQFQPSANGRGGSEKFVTEVTTTAKGKEMKFL